MTALESANLCMQKRGYIVIAQGNWERPGRIGECVLVEGSDDDLNEKVHITSITDAQDWIAQCQLNGRGIEGDDLENYRFFRAVAE